jgi:hypothetical protein
MGDIINLRKRRKKAEKEQEAARAAANRLSHGRTKAERLLDAADAEKRRRHLDAHHIDGGERE